MAERRGAGLTFGQLITLTFGFLLASLFIFVFGFWVGHDLADQQATRQRQPLAHLGQVHDLGGQPLDLLDAEACQSPAHTAYAHGALDDLVRDALQAFAADVHARTWLAKELDCVNRFVFRHLAPRVQPGGPLHDLGQIRIEGNTPQPPGIGSKPSARKDLVIWADPDATCFHDPHGDGRWLARHTRLAIIEWKADLRARKRPRLDAHDLAWLGAAARHWPNFVGYAVLLHREVLLAARC